MHSKLDSVRLSEQPWRGNHEASIARLQNNQSLFFEGEVPPNHPQLGNCMAPKMFGKEGYETQEMMYD